MEDRSKEPNRPFRVAENRCGGMDHPSNHRGFRVIPPIEGLAPTPILRFIGIELERRGDDQDQANREEARDHYDRKLGILILEERSRKHDLPLMTIGGDINPSSHVWLICNEKKLSHRIHRPLT